MCGTQGYSVISIGVRCRDLVLWCTTIRFARYDGAVIIFFVIFFFFHSTTYTRRQILVRNLILTVQSLYASSNFLFVFSPRNIIVHNYLHILDTGFVIIVDGCGSPAVHITSSCSLIFFKKLNAFLTNFVLYDLTRDFNV